MKTLKLVIAMLTILVSSTFAKAAGEFKFNVDKTKGNAFYVEFKYSKPTDISVRIVDNSGKKLLNEYYENAHSMIKKFRLVDFADGTYDFIIREDSKTTIKPFTIDGGMVQFLDKQRDYFKPSVRMVDSRLYVDLLAFADRPVYMKIEDQTGEILYYESVKQVKGLKKIFNTEKLKKGKYVLTMMNNDIMYSHPFNIVQ